MTARLQLASTNSADDNSARRQSHATILVLLGWRLFFYMNERNEPMHVHARKGDAECKFWLYAEMFDIEEAFSYGLTPRLRREIRKIIFDHFELIAAEWENLIEERRREDI